MACLFPFNVKNPLYPLPGHTARIPVPCGRCPDCLKRRVNEWSFRLQFEERSHKTAFFCTFTYASPPLSDNGFMTLRKIDFQAFMMRLRKSYAYYDDGKWCYDKVPSIKYYVCGEYGTKFKRPHYHAIIFGADIDNIKSCWEDVSMLDKVTGDVSVIGGLVDVGTVTGASIGYTLKYINKGKVVPQFDRDDRQPEFSMMSKRLGAGYLNKDVIEYHRADISRQYLTNPDGFKVGMPRYYREKIWTKEERRDAAKVVAARHEDQEQIRKSAYLIREGSLDNYDKDVHDSKRMYIENFKRRQNEKRKDV